MFSPFPMHDDGWFVAHGIMSDGNEIDLITGEELDLRKPERIAHHYSSQRWRKYSMNLRRETHRAYRAGYVRWLIQRHEESRSIAEAGATLVAVRLTYMREQTLPDVFAEAMPQPMPLFETIRPGTEVVARAADSELTPASPSVAE